jgi:hypothetical protein
VRRERDDGLTPESEDIVPMGLGRDALDVSVVARGQTGQMRVEVIAHIFFVVSRRVNVDKRARQFEKIHSIRLFWMSETKGRNREDTNRGCCLSIALHPNQWMTVNRP